MIGCLANLVFLTSTVMSQAADCTNPDALGTSRTIVVDPTEHPRIGTMQYNETLPLNDHEVVLSFDDGPLPAHTNAILDILAENPLGLSVQEIVDHLDEAQLEIKRRTLVVRLHRMVHAGKLASRAHGHYALSEAERTRRRA